SPPGPAPQDPDKILQGRARRRRDETQRRRHGRQGPLAGRIEQALLGQPTLERLELPLQPPLAILDDRPDDQLVLAALLIDADFSIQDHLPAIAQAHRLPGGVSAEQDRRNLRARILERKINVPAALDTQVGHLAPHPARPDLTLQALLHAAGEGADTLHPTAVSELSTPVHVPGSSPTVRRWRRRFLNKPSPSDTATIR